MVLATRGKIRSVVIETTNPQIASPSMIAITILHIHVSESVKTCAVAFRLSSTGLIYLALTFVRLYTGDSGNAQLSLLTAIFGTSRGVRKAN